MRLCWVLADDIEDGVGVGVLDGVPPVGRRTGLMDHHKADRALAGGFLIFVGPTAVVGHGLAAEVANAGLVIGVVDQDECDLAVEIDPLEVVPAAFRRLDAIAYEN